MKIIPRQEKHPTPFLPVFTTRTSGKAKPQTPKMSQCQHFKCLENEFYMTLTSGTEDHTQDTHAVDSPM